MQARERKPHAKPPHLATRTHPRGCVQSDLPRYGHRSKLAGNADPISRLPHAALEHVTHSEVATDVLDVDRFAFVSEGRIAGNDEQALLAGQRSDDVFDHPVREILLLWIAAHVVKRQHG